MEPITLDVDPASNREAELTTLGGAFKTFNPRWTYVFPVELEVIRKLNAYGKSHGGITATDQARTTIKMLTSEITKARAINGGDADADLSARLLMEYEDTAKALKPHQRAASQFISDREGILLADQPGLGKTLATISGIVGAGIEGDILVLSPSDSDLVASRAKALGTG